DHGAPGHARESRLHRAETLLSESAFGNNRADAVGFAPEERFSGIRVTGETMLVTIVPDSARALRVQYMEPDIRMFRHVRLPMRVLSLRTIVIVAALSVIVLVVMLRLWVWIGVNNDQYSQLDRRLDSVSSLGDINTLLNNTQLTNPDRPAPDGDLVRTVRIGDVSGSV